MTGLVALVLLSWWPEYVVDHRLEAEWDRLDRSVYYSAPDSLRLDALLGETAYYRFPERRVRGGQRYRLSFRYMVAMGSVGECTVKVHQYHDDKVTWRLLGEGTKEEGLLVVGRWTLVVMDFRAQGEATSVAVTFRLESPCEVGEAWVDDVVLRPAGEPVKVGP